MKNQLKVKTRVGKISYTNSIPFYHGLEKTVAVDFFESYPSKINAAMHEGEIDIAPISSLEYLNHQNQYYLLPDLAIGSRDFSGSVILFSRERVEHLNGEKVALTSESLSSVTLLQILLRFKYDFSNDFTVEDADPAELLERHKAALLIGDRALFYHPKEFVYKFDLSELWWNWTQKPFCFAVWAVRRAFADAYPEETAAFHELLKKNTERNLAHLETLLKESLGVTFLDDRFPKIFGYLFNLSFGLDVSMVEGLELFYRLAERLGVSPRAKRFEFFKKDSL